MSTLVENFTSARAQLAVASVSVAYLASTVAPRYAPSARALPAFVDDVLAALEEEARVAAHNTRMLAAGVGKGWESVAEAQKVTGRQLAQLAVMIDSALAEGDASTAATFQRPALRLLRQRPMNERSFVQCAAAPSLRLSLAGCMQLCSAVGLHACVVSGPGLAAVATDDVPGALDRNLLRVSFPHGGAPLETVLPADVCVRVSGGRVVSTALSLTTPGVLEVRYSVPAGHYDTVSITVDAFGSPLPASPWHIPVSVCCALCACVCFAVLCIVCCV